MADAVVSLVGMPRGMTPDAPAATATPTATPTTAVRGGARARCRSVAVAWREAARRAAMAIGAAAALLCGLALPLAVHAAEALPTAADPALEARVLKLAAELRCLVCQNQTIADSHAGLAVDLRNQVRDMLRQGKSDKEVLAYMTARYGDFVLYRPPMKESTALLWLGPGLLFLTAVAALVLLLRRRARTGDEAFEPDPEPLDNDPDPPRGGSAAPAQPASR